MELVRRKVALGILACLKPHSVTHGNGTDRACDGCGRSIRDTQIQAIIHYDRVITIRVHAACLQAWQIACRESDTPTGEGS